MRNTSRTVRPERKRRHEQLITRPLQVTIPSVSSFTLKKTHQNIAVKIFCSFPDWKILHSCIYVSFSGLSRCRSNVLLINSSFRCWLYTSWLYRNFQTNVSHYTYSISSWEYRFLKSRRLCYIYMWDSWGLKRVLSSVADEGVEICFRFARYVVPQDHMLLPHLILSFFSFTRTFILSSSHYFRLSRFHAINILFRGFTVQRFQSIFVFVFCSLWFPSQRYSHRL